MGKAPLYLQRVALKRRAIRAVQVLLGKENGRKYENLRKSHLFLFDVLDLNLDMNFFSNGRFLMTTNEKQTFVPAKLYLTHCLDVNSSWE